MRKYCCFVLFVFWLPGTVFFPADVFAFEKIHSAGNIVSPFSENENFENQNFDGIDAAGTGIYNTTVVPNSGTSHASIISSITITSNVNDVCKTGDYVITYTIDSPADPTNIFIVEIYKPTPVVGWVNIGSTGLTDTAQPITVTIPGNLVVGGGYKYRVRSTSPAVISAEYTGVSVWNAMANANPITGISTVCQGDSMVVYTEPVISGALYYLWGLPPGATITSGDSSTSITVRFSGSSTSGNVTVQGANNGCNGSVATFPVTVNPTVGNPGTITGPTTVCQGQPGNIYSVPAITNATGYAWTLPTGATITSGSNTNSITVDYSGSAASGNITVQGTGGCPGSVSAPLAVTVGAGLGSPGAITGTASVCQGQTGVVYSIPSITNATGYSWTLPTGASITSGSNTNSITVSFSGSATSGNVTVQGTSAGCTGAVSSPFAVTVGSSVGSPGTITGSASVCQGGTGIVYSVPAITNATGYIWTLPTGATITSGSNTNSITVSFSGSSTSGNVTVQGTSGGCTGSVSSPFAVTVGSGVGNAGTITGTTNVCQGQTGIVYSVPAITGATGYAWTLPTGASITAGANTNSITVSFSGSAGSGNITVQGTGASCNGGVSTPLAVTVGSGVGNPGTITGSVSICQGDTGVVYTVPAVTNATGYIWTLPTGATVTAGANTNTITVGFSGSATSGFVTVQGTNAGCTGAVSSPLSVAVNPGVSNAGPISGPATVCQGQIGIYYSVPSIPGATSYTWTLPAGTSVTGVTNNDSILVSFSGSASSGTITVQGTNGTCNGLISSLPVTVNGAVGNPGTIAGNDTVCQGQTGVVYSIPSISNATGYTWTLPAGATITSGTNTNSITVSFSGSATSGNVTVQGTNSGCSAGPVSAPFAVTVNPGIANAGTITGTTNVCQGNTGVVYSVAAITNATGYIWTLPTGATITAGANTNSITVDFSGSANSGNITVQGTGVTCNGAVSAPLVITVSSNVGSPGTITGTVSVCQGQTGVGYSVPSITNATTYVWTVPTGATITAGSNTNLITVSFSGSAASGNVTVQGSNAGCGAGTVSSPFAVSVNSSVANTVAITSNQGDTVCPGSITFGATPNNGLNYQWKVNGINAGTNSPVFTTTLLTDSQLVTCDMTSASVCANPPVASDTILMRIVPITKPVITNNNIDSICKGTRGLSFGVQNPDPAQSYQWSTIPATTVIHTDTFYNCAIDFPVSTDSAYKVIVTSSLQSCSSKDTVLLGVYNSTAQDTSIIYLYAPVNILICLNNTFDSYQWGFDEDSAHGYKPDTLTGEIYQNYLAGTSFDLSKRFYWVITRQGNCFTKSYYNRPPRQGGHVIREITSDLDVTISPNPLVHYFNTKMYGLYNGKIDLSVIDIMGRTILEKEFWKESVVADQTINMENQRAGIYFVRVTYNQNEQKVFKIIIER